MIEPTDPQHTLHQDDALALEALIDAGYEPDLVDPALRPRARRVAHLLGLLGTTHDDLATDPALAHATFLAVRRHRPSEGEPALAIADADALDALVFARFEPAAVPTPLRERAERHAALARLLTDTAHAEHAPSDDLTARTLARVQEEIDRRGEAMRLDRRGVPSISWRDVVSIAALLLVVASVVMPILTQTRHLSQRAACSSNLAAAALGLGQYGLDHDGSLPVATAGFGSGTQPGQARWWNVGQPRESNAANLYHLTRSGYNRLADLACPGNATAQLEPISADARDFAGLRAVSFSYKLPTASMRFTAPGPDAIVLADRSPVILAAYERRPVDPFADSTNHGSRGQHLLRADGSVLWARSAVLESGDNIWLPRTIEVQVRRVAAAHGITLEGRELPEDSDDTFLGP